MQTISHRGYWKVPTEKNTREAFARSFTMGFGTETDVRDLAGTLVISHDPPSGGEMTLNDLLQMAKPFDLPLALNVKADGLAVRINETLKSYDYRNWFVFDMSIPDTRGQLAAGNPVFARMSEVETAPPYMDQAAGIWLDAFTSDSWRIEVLSNLVTRAIPVCLVSPELHKREHQPFWHELKKVGLHSSPLVTLCTDLPEDAVTFFGEYE